MPRDILILLPEYLDSDIDYVNLSKTCRTLYSACHAAPVLSIVRLAGRAFGIWGAHSLFRISKLPVARRWFKYSANTFRSRSSSDTIDWSGNLNETGLVMARCGVTTYDLRRSFAMIRSFFRTRHCVADHLWIALICISKPFDFWPLCECHHWAYCDEPGSMTVQLREQIWRRCMDVFTPDPGFT